VSQHEIWKNVEIIVYQHGRCVTTNIKMRKKFLCNNKMLLCISKMWMCNKNVLCNNKMFLCNKNVMMFL
jgi:hypothetical protein